MQDSSDGYSDENYEEGFEDDDGAEDRRIEKVRAAMAKQNAKAKSFVA